VWSILADSPRRKTGGNPLALHPADQPAKKTANTEAIRQPAKLTDEGAIRCSSCTARSWMPCRGKLIADC
jgi:hypothetical protein